MVGPEGAKGREVWVRHLHFTQLRCMRSLGVAIWCDLCGQQDARALQAPGCEVFSLPWVSREGC